MRKGFRNSVLKGAALSVALMLALPVAGCAGKADSATTAVQTEGVTSSDVAEQTKATKEAAPDVTQETTQVTTTAAPVTPNEFTLDGVKEHHFISDSYCYLESEKYFLLLDKDMVWGRDYYGNDRVVDNHVKKLRKSLGKAGSQIKTVFARGYKITEE